MFCANCGEAIPDDCTVCPNCGKDPRVESPDSDEAREDAVMEEGAVIPAEDVASVAEEPEVSESVACEDSSCAEEAEQEEASPAETSSAFAIPQPVNEELEQFSPTSSSEPLVLESVSPEADEVSVSSSPLESEGAESATVSTPQSQPAASAAVEQGASGQGKKGGSKGLPKPALIAVVLALVALVGYFVAREQGKAELREQLTRTWYASEDSIIKVLDVDDDSMTYSLVTGYSFLDTTLGTWEWRPTSKDTFEVCRAGDVWVEHTVSFTSTGTGDGIIVRPSLTSTESMEVWVDVD